MEIGYIVLIFIASCIAILITIILFEKLGQYRKSKRDISGQHVVITGGSSGIGKEIGFLAAKRGAHVTILARDVSKLQSASQEILSYMRNKNQRMNFYQVDISNWLEVEEVMRKCTSEIGEVDILVNSAGYCYPSAIEDIPLKHFKGMMDVNYLGNVHMIKSVLPSMKSRRQGNIVIVSSMAGLSGLFGYTGYSASKFALRGFAEALQMEVKPWNVSVTINFPPMTDTPCLVDEHKLRPLETKYMEETAGLFQPKEVAESILNDALAGHFFSSTGLDGHLLIAMCAGMAPSNSVLGVTLQVLFLGPLRLISLGFLANFNRIVAKCAALKQPIS